MEGEIYKILISWSAVILSLCYCYGVKKRTQKGLKRLLCVFPVMAAFLLIPLWFQSVHAIGITSFFVIWLGNSKLLLLAFDQGPLVDASCLMRFVAVGCLPIKIKRKLNHQKSENSFQARQNEDDPAAEITRNEDKGGPFQNRQIEDEPSMKITGKIHSNPNPRSENQNMIGQDEEIPFQIIRNNESPDSKNTKKVQKSNLKYALKGLFLGITLYTLDEYTDNIHPIVLFPLLSFHLYLSLEIILTIFTAMARILLNLELDSHFNEPYMSSSLQDFWGRRWNLTATTILRQTVYNPVFQLLTRVMNPEDAQLSSAMATFVVSGFIHELIVYYIGRLKPTWETTSFFVLQGAFVVAEVAVKNKWRRRTQWRLPRLVAATLTVAFVIATASWLFFPPLLRCDAYARGSKEFAAVKTFFKNLALSFMF